MRRSGLKSLIAPEHFSLRVRAPLLAWRARPGQFANLTVARPGEPAPVLPRPMAVYGWDAARGEAEFVYRVIGDGTALLAGRRPGETLELVGPLGRGFELQPAARGALLIGRGIGICSLTARRMAVVDSFASTGMSMTPFLSSERVSSSSLRMPAADSDREIPRIR